MKCLCCGKEVGVGEEKSRWHKKCIQKFFGTDALPEIELDNKVIEKLAYENSSRGYTVPGVQKKLSLHLMSGDTISRLTLVDYPSGYILKPQVKEYMCLPESEHLVMSMADAVGIKTVPHALLESTGVYSYITKRVDRVGVGGNIKKIAMEDFCQLDNRLTENKYKGSYERCAKIISKYSSRPGIDMTEFYIRLIFCYMVGNSDMHMKNFSLMENNPGEGNYILSPAYDLLPVNMIMPNDKDELALPLNGKKRNVTRKNFLIFAEECGISPRSAEKMMDRLLAQKSTLVTMCYKSMLPSELQEQLANLISIRTDNISQ